MSEKKADYKAVNYKELYELEKSKTEGLERSLVAKKNKVKGGFYMMSREAEKHMRALQRQSPNGALIFSILRQHMQIGTNTVTISNKVLAKILGLSRSTISRAIKVLKENNYVSVVKSGSTNCYTVNQRIAFSGHPGQRQAVFNSVVVAHECEQEENWDSIEPMKSMPVFMDNERPYLNTSDELPPPDQKDLNLN